MFTITIPQMKSFLTHIAFEMREPVMLWGQPGVGKSEGVHQFTDGIGGVLVDIRLSQYDSVDLRGIPVAEAGMLTTWCPPATLPFEGNDAFPDDKPIVLFLDEINSAAPSVSAVAYQLVNDRGVGEHRLKANVVVVAAGNREGDRGVTNRMPTPLANRFTHTEIGVDTEAFVNYGQEIALAPVGLAFLQFRKPLLSTFDPSLPHKAFATPRTWVKALRYFEADMPEDIKRVAIAGAVGEGPATEFWGFVDVWHKMIPMADIERDPKGAPLPDGMAMTYAVSVAISGSMDLKTVKAFNTYLDRLDPEFAVMAWQMAVKRDADLFSAPEFLDFSKKYRAVFRS